MIHDFCVIGGGIVGLATAMSLLDRQPGASVVVLEKESALARHQTGHNSGVIHSGIYYQPGSLKADLCRRGAGATKEFAAEHGIPVLATGKLLVATDAQESGRLATLRERAAVNQIAVQPLSASELAEQEPHITGRDALLVESTGSIDYTEVCLAMAKVIAARGGAVELGVEVAGIRETGGTVSIVAGTGSQEQRWQARRLVVCGGLQADRLARLAAVPTEARIVPFRGEYFKLPASRGEIVRRHIYPVPDPSMPFLGVHLTRMVNGEIWVGPNAVLGRAREGYSKAAVAPRDIADYVRFPGFWHFAKENLRTGVNEMRNSVFKRGYLDLVRAYCPELELSDLEPATAGIRAQAMLPSGELVHDFMFAATDRQLHVINAPSPAATSAIPIGQMIAERCIGAAA